MFEVLEVVRLVNVGQISTESALLHEVNDIHARSGQHGIGLRQDSAPSLDHVSEGLRQFGASWRPLGRDHQRTTRTAQGREQPVMVAVNEKEIPIPAIIERR